MTNRWIQRNALPALMAGLACVLLLLAALQYRWIGEISEADRNRLGRGLFVASEQFRRDFNRELSEIAAALPVRASVPGRGDWDTLAEEYLRWAETASGALYVDSIFVIEPSTDRQPERTLKLDPASAHFEPVEPPANLQAALDSWPQPPRGPRGGPMGTRTAFWAFLPDGPALATTLFAGRRGGPGRERGSIDAPRLVVYLDREAIVGSLLPEIDSRFVVSDGAPPYQLAVIDPSTSQLLYSNADIDPQEFLEAERQTPLIYSGEELLARSAARRGRLGRPGGDPPGGPPSAAESDDRRFFPRAVVSSVPDSGGWILAARHSGGTLSTVVSSLRRRNLAISFGILLLLAAGMGLALISARRAERLAQLQMEFVAGVSHELRTPIAVIRQAADNLADGIVSSPDQTKEYGRLVRTEGRRLTNMVEQTLQFASSRTGKQNFVLEEIDPTQLIAAAVGEVQPELTASAVELSVEVADDLPSVVGDATAIAQCLRNLLSNAIKYRGQSSSVKLTASVDGNSLRIDVIDTGIGISTDDLPHVFEPFYRGQQAIDAQVQGSGLGLGLAKQAAEAAGGSLAVASAPGVGSTFSLRLPLSSGSEANV